MNFNSNITNSYKVLLILLFSIIYPIAGTAFAQNPMSNGQRTATIYTIYNIEIDQTSRNVTTARDAALLNGQRMALDRLFRRIILISDREKLPNFSNAEITEFISGFEVNDERRSGVRYLASLVVHFNRSKINKILSQYEIPYAETLGTAVSIMPVLEEAGTLTLWENTNDWRLAWETHDVINNLVPVKIPEPTLKNRMYISALQAKNHNLNAIRGYINENMLNELIIATASVHKTNFDNQLHLEITLHRNSSTQQGNDSEPEKTISVSMPAADEFDESNIKALYNKGVDAASDWIDDLWKSKVLVNYGVASKIFATGTLNELGDWLTIQEQLRHVNLVRNINLLNITINQVDLEIEFAGDPEQLALSLAQQGLNLYQDKNQKYMLAISNYAGSRNLEE